MPVFEGTREVAVGPTGSTLVVGMGVFDMQPRWNDHWLDEYHHTSFIGGTNSVDLWIDDEGDLRMSKGHGGKGWDYWMLADDGEVVRMCADTDLTDDMVVEAFIYLNMFVPDWKERMKEARTRCATQVV